MIFTKNDKKYYIDVKKVFENATDEDYYVDDVEESGVYVKGNEKPKGFENVDFVISLCFNGFDDRRVSLFFLNHEKGRIDRIENAVFTEEERILVEEKLSEI